VPSGAGDGIEGDSDIDDWAASGVQTASNAEKANNVQMSCYFREDTPDGIGFMRLPVELKRGPLPRAEIPGAEHHLMI